MASRPRQSVPPASAAPTRAGALAATATTLVALAAMTAAASAQVVPRAIDTEIRSESRMVRVVAAAVAAAARDLLGTERCTAAVAVLSQAPADLPASGAPAHERPHRPAGVLRLAPRLLDLPPPAC